MKYHIKVYAIVNYEYHLPNLSLHYGPSTLNIMFKHKHKCPRESEIKLNNNASFIHYNNKTSKHNVTFTHL